VANNHGRRCPPLQQYFYGEYMALDKCRECTKEVSTEAETCPHCGVKSPTRKTATVKRVDLVGGLFLLALAAFVLIKCSSDADYNEKKAAADAAAKEAQCKTDLQCLGDKAIVGAGVYCKDPIERLAKYSARWTDGTFEPKFSRFRWLSQQGGTITMIGDKIQFQNGFGAYQNAIYECDFDPVANKVLDVRASPGHI